LAEINEQMSTTIKGTESDAETTSLHTQLTTTLGRIATLEARDPEPQDGPAEAGSSS
ncbi:hypothetical protein Tco_0164205, partial [Tanacetum coccineum]